MAQTLMTPPEEPKNQSNYEPHLGADPELESNGVFASLWSNLKDAFFPEKLPPLKLESKPVAVADRMAVKRDPVSTSIAVVLHVVIILLIIWFAAKKIVPVVTAPPAVTKADLTAPPPIKVPVMKKAAGGGGGAHDIAPVTKGRIPPASPQPIVPPSKPPVIKPLLEVAPTVAVQPNMQMKSNLPNFGMPNAPSVGVASMGNCHGSNCSGIGGGSGPGVGEGHGGNTGGDVYQIGGDVSEPRLIYQPEPDYSEEARKAKYQGECIVNLVVDATGKPTRIRVIRKLGMGLDEKAVEAVSHYKFKPAMKGGKPVAVELNVAVNFQIF